MPKILNLLAVFLFTDLSHSQTSKCQNKDGNNDVDWAIVYKAPAQLNGKIIFANAAGAWDNGAQPFTNAGGHSFGKAIEDVVGNNRDIKFLAYNNVPPRVPNLKTKSNSKGIIILSIAAATDSAAWIVHTVPGFPAAKTGYSWPVAENARGHLLICLTISESQINAIEIYKKVIVKVLKKTIKVWSRRDSKLKGDCRVSQRHIRLIKSPATIRDHNTNLEADITNWAVSDPGNIFCHIDKPYFVRDDINTSINLFNYEEKMLKFSELLALLFFIKFSHSQTSKCQNKPGNAAADWAIVYKAPGQDTGKIIFATAAGSWDNGASAFTNNGGHSFAKTLEDIVRNHMNIKFLAYNNAPPGVPNVNTKSNSKGVIILSTAADSAAWIVHTVPGFPTARTPYNWPAAENARGHLLICLTISESQINAIAASLLLVQPMVHYNDIPETETAGMPYFKKLAEGKVPTLPPFTSRRSIRTENAGGPVAVHIYSKSESSKYEIYKKVIVKVLKKSIKVWSRRDNILKGDCRGSKGHIRLIKSPAAINGHNTNLEADITNWAVSDPGNIFCHIDKPYF
ncbi:Deoxyribonuclease-2-alpha, partial [Trichinella nativa]